MDARNETESDEGMRDISVWSEAIPLRERLLDRMADLLFCADDGLTMLARHKDTYLYEQCAGPLHAAFNIVNELMRRLCD
jgi:hypothetical protein